MKLPIKLEMVFIEGDYLDALLHYEAAKRWVVETGCAFHPKIHGNIHRPAHPESPEDSPFFPLDLCDKEGWSLRVTFECLTHETFEWLKSLMPPEGAGWKDLESSG